MVELVFAPRVARVSDPLKHNSVVAVPGLGADADAWLARGVSWLSDENMLPSSIPYSRIMRFTYESSWFGKDSILQMLSVVADELLRGIIALRQVSGRIFVCRGS